MGLRSQSKARERRKLALLAVVVVAMVWFVQSDLYPAAVLRSWFSGCPVQVVAAGEDPVVNPDSAWKVITKERVSACDNRPGLKVIYVTVLDEDGNPYPGVPVRFDTEPSVGIAYDHPFVWGTTDARGYLEWDHLGKPTRYRMWVGDEVDPLLVNIRTDFGNEYCRPPGSMPWAGNLPVNRPGIYSWRIEVQAK